MDEYIAQYEQRKQKRFQKDTAHVSCLPVSPVLWVLAPEPGQIRHPHNYHNYTQTENQTHPVPRSVSLSYRSV